MGNRFWRTTGAIFTVVSTLVFLAGAVFWIASYFRSEFKVTASRASSQGPVETRQDQFVESRAGAFGFGHIRIDMTQHGEWSLPIPMDASLANLASVIGEHRTFLWRDDSTTGRRERVEVVLTHPVQETRAVTHTWRTDTFHVVIPYWAVVLPAMVAPTFWVLRRLKQRARARIGLCRKCGYDLRACPDVCSECGTPHDAGYRARQREAAARALEEKFNG